jgi:hypothetical protein
MKSTEVIGEIPLLVALGSIHQLESLSTSKPDAAQAMLAGAFSVLAHRLVSTQLNVNEAAALRVVSEYFQHRGDWSAMRRCSGETAARVIGIPIEQLRDYVQVAVARVGAHVERLFTP